MLERDMRLVALTRRALSCGAWSARRCRSTLIARAKAAGLPVTCGISINHLTLNENDIGDYRTFLKLAPPLRSEDERLALVEALGVGLIDVDRLRPQSAGRRDQAPAVRRGGTGAIGLETHAVGRRCAWSMPGRFRCRVCCRDDDRGRPTSSACRKGGSPWARRPT